MAAEKATLRALVRGKVQGVYFRDFVRAHALRLGLAGYVRNLPDGASLEVVAEGERQALEELLRLLRQGPPRARVQQVEARWDAYSVAFQGFSART